VNDLLSVAGLLIPPSPRFDLAAYFHNYPLRDYQHRMLLEAANLMAQGYRRILIQAPTGAGKTVMARALMGSGVSVGWTSEFLVHRKELIRQTSESFTKGSLEHGFVATGFPFTPDVGVTLAGIQTLVNRLDLLMPPNLAVVDECHHATSNTWRQVLDSYGDAHIIGLTATPERLDGTGLNEQFDAMVVGPSVRELIDRGFLSPFVFYGPSVPDMSNVPVSNGDFVRSAVDEIVDKPKVIGSVVEHYLKLAKGQQGLIFGNSRKHSRHLAETFTGEGIPAMHVDGSMSAEERNRFDAAFRAGDILLGCNPELFSEGYDVPNVSYLGDAGPSRSEIKVRQRWGRPLRIGGAAVATIADHAGNWKRINSLPDSDRQWSLEGTKSRKKSAVPDHTPVTQCKACFRVYPSAARVCPGCASETPAQPRIVREEAGTLTKVEREELRKAAEVRRKAEEKECLSFKQFLSLGQARGYGNPRGWAKIQCRLRRIPVPPS